MHKLALVFLLLTTTACSEFPFVYKIDIEQGNIIEQEAIDQLIPGLTKDQVRFILGSPINIDTFNQQRWDYIYSISRGGGGHRQERLSLYFTDNRLAYFQGDFIPSGAMDDEQAVDQDRIQEQDKQIETETESINQNINDFTENTSAQAEDGIEQILIQDETTNE
jgi:outer membrane protein assembly factor BamE